MQGLAPLITGAQVIAQDADNGKLTVVLKTGGQVVDVDMLYHGAADALRIDQKPMPSRGTWGLISFPYGDWRNGFWIGAVLPAAMDAINTTNAASGAGPFDPFMDYQASFGGFWRMLDGSGQSVVQWPDQSYFTMALASGVPVTYRHTVQGNKRTKQIFNFTDRVAKAPASLYTMQFHHQSGSTLTFDASGSFLTAINVSGMFSVTGGPSGTPVGFLFDSSGTVTVSGLGVSIILSSGGTLTFGTSGTTVVVDNSGDIKLTASSKVLLSAPTVEIDSSSVLVGGSGASDPVTKYNELKSAFDGHTHKAVMTGGGISGPPSSPLSGADSSVLKVTG